MQANREGANKGGKLGAWHLVYSTSSPWLLAVDNGTTDFQSVAVVSRRTSDATSRIESVCVSGVSILYDGLEVRRTGA